MDEEYSVIGKIFKKPENFGDFLRYSFKGLEFSIRASKDSSNLTFSIYGINAVLKDYSYDFFRLLCKELSLKFSSLVYLAFYKESFGLTNVFNGGSDYESLEESCILYAFKNGTFCFEEHTDSWNEKMNGDAF